MCTCKYGLEQTFKLLPATVKLIGTISRNYLINRYSEVKVRGRCFEIGKLKHPWVIHHNNRTQFWVCTVAIDRDKHEDTTKSYENFVDTRKYVYFKWIWEFENQFWLLEVCSNSFCEILIFVRRKIKCLIWKIAET